MLRGATRTFMAVTWLSLAIVTAAAADLVEDLAFEECASADCTDASFMAESDDSHLPSARLDLSGAASRATMELPPGDHLRHDGPTLVSVPIIRSARWTSTLNPRAPSHTLVPLRI